MLSWLVSHSATRVHALCDINFESSREGWGSDAAVPRTEEFGVDLIYADAEEMLDNAGVDIAIIGTPMPLHVPQSLMALERGIHVFSEVPAGVNIAECKELVAAVKASPATYMMAENYCYTKPNVLIKELVEQGYFGELYFGEGEYVHELKEFGEPTRKALIMDLSPEGKQASMFGLYYLLRDAVVSVAAFGGAFLWMISPATNFLAAFGFGALGTLWFALRGRDLSIKEDGRIRSYEC